MIQRRGVIDNFERNKRVERIQWVASLTSYKQPAKSQTEASSRVLRKRKPIFEQNANSAPIAKQNANSAPIAKQNANSAPIAEQNANSAPIAKQNANSAQIAKSNAINRPVVEADALSRSFVRAMILAGVDFSGLDALKIGENIPQHTSDTDSESDGDSDSDSTEGNTDLKGYAEYLAMVKEEVELMPSLQDRCVVAVRKYLCGGHVYAKVDSLPLPKPLQDLLKLTNV